MYKKIEVTEDKLLGLFSRGKLIDLVFSIVETVVKKNTDYGDAWQTYGIFTPLIRINDKMLRIENLSDGKQALVIDESIEDNLRDIVGYALLALLWLQENKEG